MLDALRCCVHDGGLRQEEHGLSHSGHHPLVLCQVQHRLQPPHLRVHEQKGLWFSGSVNSRCSKELYRFVPLHSRVLSAGQICNEKYFFTALMARKAILPSMYTLTHTQSLTPMHLPTRSQLQHSPYLLLLQLYFAFLFRTS